MNKKEKKPLNVLPLVTEVAVEEVYKGRTMDEIRTFCDTAVLADGFKEEDGLLFYNPRENEKPIFERAVKAISYFRSRYKNGEKVLVAGHAAFNTVMIFHIMGYTASPVYDIELLTFFRLLKCAFLFLKEIKKSDLYCQFF